MARIEYAPSIVVTIGTSTFTQPELSPPRPTVGEHESAVTVATTGGMDATLSVKVVVNESLSMVAKRVSVGVGEHAI